MASNSRQSLEAPPVREVAERYFLGGIERHRGSKPFGRLFDSPMYLAARARTQSEARYRLQRDRYVESASACA